MDSKKICYGLSAALVLLFVGLFVSVQGANTLLVRQSQTLVGLKAQDQAEANSQTQLAEEKKEVTTYADLNTIAKTVVPQDKDQAEAVREIVNLAAASGIPQLSSISFPPSTLGGKQIKTSNGLTQVTPVPGMSGVYELQITVTQDPAAAVPYASFTNFLAKLEQNRRTAQVSSIDVQPDSKNPNVTSFTLVINEFIKP